MLILVATLWERLLKLTIPLRAVWFVLPCNAPLPALRLAVTTVVVSLLRKLPYWSSIRTTGCWLKATPAVAVAEGWVWRVKRLAVAALTTMFEEVAPARAVLAKSMVILV